MATSEKVFSTYTYYSVANLPAGRKLPPMKRLAGLLLVLGLAPQLSAQIFGPGVIHSGNGNPIKITIPSVPGAQAATVIINPPTPPVQAAPVMSPIYQYPYQNFQAYGYQRGLPMHSMAMSPGFMYARPLYVQPTMGSMIIITPPRVHSMQPAKVVFGR